MKDDTYASSTTASTVQAVSVPLDDGYRAGGYLAGPERHRGFTDLRGPCIVPQLLDRAVVADT